MPFEFQINLSGSLNSVLNQANKNLGDTEEKSKKAKKEIALFEGEIGKLGGTIGGLSLNFQALSKGGPLFTFDLAEGLKSVLELGTKVVEKFVDLGREMVKTAGRAEDINLALKLNVGEEGAKQLEALSKEFAKFTRFSSEQVKQAWLPLTQAGMKEPQLLEDLTLAAGDVAARLGQESAFGDTLHMFRAIKLKDQLPRQAFTNLGLSYEEFYKDLGAQLNLSADAAAEYAKSHRTDAMAMRLINTAYNLIARRGGAAAGTDALQAGTTLGGEIARLDKAKETLFSGLANNPGMEQVKGVLHQWNDFLYGPAAQDLMNQLGTSAGKLFTTIFGQGQEGASKLESALRGIVKGFDSFVDRFQKNWPDIRAGFDGLLTVAQALASTLLAVGRVVAKIAPALEWAASRSSLFGGMDDVSRGKLEALKAEQAISGTVGAPGQGVTLYDAGVDLGKDLEAGLRSPEALDAHSPSQKMIELGGDIADGLTIGVQGGRNPGASITYSPTINVNVTGAGSAEGLREVLTEAEQEWRIHWKRQLDEFGATLGVSAT